MPERPAIDKPPWLEYYKATSRGPPWDTLTKALSLFETEPIRGRRRFAIDLGSGAGRDTLELLRRGWKVLAVDNEPDAIKWVRKAVPSKYRARFTARLDAFETVKLPKCDLVNASYSLPFCRPASFNDFWARIVASLRSGGRFAGHLFGVRDEWFGDPELTFHTADQVKALLAGLTTELFNEKEWEGRAVSRRKHWHLFSVVAKKT